MPSNKITIRESLLMATIGILVVGWVVPRVPFVRRITQPKALQIRSEIQTIIDRIYSTGSTSIEDQKMMGELMSRLNTAGYNVFVDTKGASPLVTLGY